MSIWFWIMIGIIGLFVFNIGLLFILHLIKLKRDKNLTPQYSNPIGAVDKQKDGSFSIRIIYPVKVNSVDNMECYVPYYKKNMIARYDKSSRNWIIRNNE